MILAVDVGNTNLVFALVDKGEIKARWRIATDPRRTADQYSVWLHQLLELEGYSREDIEGVIIGTVVPRALHNLEVLSEKYFHKTPLIAGQGAATWPLRLDVDEPQNVGADRALNAVAAHAKYPGDLLVIDFGTATTFDVVGATGAYDLSYKPVGTNVDRCEEAFIVRGITARGVVESGDCTLSPNVFADRFRIYLEAGSQVEIRVDDFSYSGPNIELRAPDGSSASAGPGGDYLTKLVYLVPVDGYYTVLVGLLNEYGVDYEITVR